MANIDQALVVFAVKKPDPHFNLLDRFLVMMERQEIPVIICFNKKDIADEPEIEISGEDLGRLVGFTGVIFRQSGHRGRRKDSGRLESGTKRNKTTTVAGPRRSWKFTL